LQNSGLDERIWVKAKTCDSPKFQSS
jgi:hypothetical protein